MASLSPAGGGLRAAEQGLQSGAHLAAARVLRGAERHGRPIQLATARILRGDEAVPQQGGHGHRASDRLGRRADQRDVLAAQVQRKVSIRVRVMITRGHPVPISPVDEAIKDCRGHEGHELLAVDTMALSESCSLGDGLNCRSDEEVPAELYHVGSAGVFAEVMHAHRRFLKDGLNEFLRPSGAAHWDSGLTAAHAIGPRKDRRSHKADSAL
mmetsp:Transcript_79618/g.200268  ORF Transcript_79618/g.200268 Transcript_79618/m.200268 type:complete len:212 (+) Transcript_79618:42-677(+)